MAFKRVFLTALLHVRRMAARRLNPSSSFVLFIYLLTFYLPVQLMSYNTECSVERLVHNGLERSTEGRYLTTATGSMEFASEC